MHSVMNNWWLAAGGKVMERVAITGLSSLCPIGTTIPKVLDALRHAKSGIVSIAELRLPPPDEFLQSQISAFLSQVSEDEKYRPFLSDIDFDRVRDVLGRCLRETYLNKLRKEDLKTLYVGVVPDFNPLDFLSPKEARNTDRFIQFAIAAAELAKEDAGLKDMVGKYYDSTRVGVVAGTGMGGLRSMEQAHSTLLTLGPGRINPFSITRMISDMAAGEISRFQEANGHIECPVAACATGTVVLGRGFELIQKGVVDMVYAVASEACLTRLGLGCFETIKALSTKDYGRPERASRPFDKDRSGFIMSEGSAGLILENMEKARKRGAKIYAEIVGFGNFADAYHKTQPDPEGEYAAQAMRFALESAAIRKDEVQYINAHGTSTYMNDKIETMAIKKVFGLDLANRIPVSSTKSLTGHLLGAAGALEGVICALALYHQFLPPTINYENPDPECDLKDYVPNHMREAVVNVALSNSFGFGGKDASVVFRRVA
jgi:3-oxoacyl-[acyl-carrier-protein] synthase II